MASYISTSYWTIYNGSNGSPKFVLAYIKTINIGTTPSKCGNFYVLLPAQVMGATKTNVKVIAPEWWRGGRKQYCVTGILRN